MLVTVMSILVRDPNDSVREAACYYLGALGPTVPVLLGKRALDRVVDALGDGQLAVRC